MQRGEQLTLVGQSRIKDKISISVTILFVSIFLSSCYQHTPWDSYQEFVKVTTKQCPTRLPAMGYEIKSDNTCTCINKKLTENWSNFSEIDKVLNEKDRTPRGYGDFIPGMLRVTYRMCDSK